MDNESNNSKEVQNQSLKKPGRNPMAVWIIFGLIFLLLGIAAFYYFGDEFIRTGPIYLFVLIAVAAAIVIIGVVFAVLLAKGKIKHQGPDYKALFIIGLTWIPIGIALKNPAFWIMGLVFMAIGLANKNKWKNRPRWQDMPPAEKNFKLAAILILGLVLLAGFAAFFLMARR